MRTRCTFTVGAGFCSCVSDSVSAGIGQGCCGTQNGRIEMKKMKKFAALFLSAALVTACVACGNDAGTRHPAKSPASLLMPEAKSPARSPMQVLKRAARHPEKL